MWVYVVFRQRVLAELLMFSIAETYTQVNNASQTGYVSVPAWSLMLPVPVSGREKRVKMRSRASNVQGLPPNPNESGKTYGTWMCHRI